MTTAPALVAPKTCPRCSGSGLVSSRVVYAGAPGGCFTCAGRGEVETDKATLAAAKQYGADRRALGEAAFAAGHEAHSGLSALEVNDPARLACAVASFAAGRDDVVPALVAYYRSL